MTTGESRYVPGAPSYSHRFHAGNVGDVWKHCVLLEVLRVLGGPSDARSLHAARGNVTYLETHAGEGRYALGATGEWSEGIARLWDLEHQDDAAGRYVAICRALGAGTARPASYPGSPLFARAALGPAATLTLWERDPDALARLRASVGGDPHVAINAGDGLTALGAAHAPTFALVDPPWTQKADWTAIPDALARAAHAWAGTALMLWYPVKSLTRPNAMHARLEAAGVSATVAELVTTSLKHQRHRLNGSGVVLVRAPAAAVAAIAAAAPVIGARCATRVNAWSLRLLAW